MKLSSKIHGVIDYLVVVFLWISPSLFKLPESIGLFTYILGGVHLALTVLTKFDMGLIKIIPLTIHGWIELAVSVILVPLAIYFGAIADNVSRNFYLGFAVAVFFTWLLTDYGTSKMEN